MRDQRPGPSEHGEYFGRYVALAPEGDIVETLKAQMERTSEFLAQLGEERGASRYAEGKWSVKEVMGHLLDTERVFAYRALSFSRGDPGPLPGFEQDDFVRDASFDARTLASLADEAVLVRRCSLTLFENLNDEEWMRPGNASGTDLTVRGIAWIIAGHELHHLAVIRERYL